MSSETASCIPPFTFPSSSLLPINFILCSRSPRGGLETWGWGFGSDTSFARIFLFMKELMLVVCLRPLLFGCSKTRTKLKKISYFVTSSTLYTMSIILSDRLFAKGTRESFGPLGSFSCPPFYRRFTVVHSNLSLLPLRSLSVFCKE